MPIADAIKPLAQSRTLAYVLLLALVAGGYALIPTVLEHMELVAMPEAPSPFFAVLSLVLGWLLVFRTNTAYQRWWEARTLWGALVNCSRNAAIKLTTQTELTTTECEQVAELLTTFPSALRAHLRGESSSATDVLALTGDCRHQPQEISRQLYQFVARLKSEQRIDGDVQRIVDAELLRLMDICGGCERILKTRIVTSYRVFARQCVVLYLFTLPWGIVHEMQFWTVPIAVVVSYFMLGLELVAEHVEEPFGYDDDDLDLDALCDTIRNSVQEVFSHQVSELPNAQESSSRIG